MSYELNQKNSVQAMMKIFELYDFINENDKPLYNMFLELYSHGVFAIDITSHQTITSSIMELVIKNSDASNIDILVPTYYDEDAGVYDFKLFKLYADETDKELEELEEFDNCIITSIVCTASIVNYYATH